MQRPDIFQVNISKIFKGYDVVREYIDYVLVINRYEYRDHLKVLGKVLQKLSKAGLKVNIEKSLF